MIGNRNIKDLLIMIFAIIMTLLFCYMVASVRVNADIKSQNKIVRRIRRRLDVENNDDRKFIMKLSQGVAGARG